MIILNIRLTELEWQRIKFGMVKNDSLLITSTDGTLKRCIQEDIKRMLDLTFGSARVERDMKVVTRMDELVYVRAGIPKNMRIEVIPENAIMELTKQQTF